MKIYFTPGFRKFFLLMVIALSVKLANAQWISNGPYGGYILGFGQKDSFLFAGTLGAGIYSSADSGAHWQLNNPDYSLTGMAVKDSNIFAGTGAGVLLSTDNGATWNTVNNGLSDSDITCIAVCGSTLIAGTYGDGIFISDNNGNSWSASVTGLITNAYVVSIAVSGSNIFTYLYNTNSNRQEGIFRSADSGNTWIEADTGIPGNVSIYCLAVNGTSIYAGMSFGNVYSSDNNGHTWSSTGNSGLPESDVVSIVFNKTGIFAAIYDDGNVASNVYVSINNGVSWSETGLVSTPINTLLATGANLFATTQGGGVYLSSDNGVTWSTINNGLNNSSIYKLAVNGSEIFASTIYHPVYLSNDNGANWTQIGNGLPVGGAVTSFAFTGNYIFAGMQTAGSEVIAGVYVSSDSGNTWTAVNNGLIDKHGVVCQVTSLAIIDSNLFAGTQSDGVYMSSNNGENWKQVNNGITNTSINAITISGSSVIAGSNAGVFISIDNGQNWTTLDSGLGSDGNYAAIITLTTCGSNTYAIGQSNTGTGLYIWSGNGTSWKPAPDSGLASAGLWSFATNCTQLYAGNYDNVFVSTDTGNLWTPVDSGLPSGGFNALAITDNNIFAGSAFEGVWQESITNIATATAKIQPSAPNAFSLFPNPAFNNFIIETTLPAEQAGGSGSQQLQLFDLTGKLLLSQSIQNSKTSIDASGLAAGVYLVSLKGAEGSATEKLIIAR